MSKITKRDDLKLNKSSSKETLEKVKNTLLKTKELALKRIKKEPNVLKDDVKDFESELKELMNKYNLYLFGSDYDLVIITRNKEEAGELRFGEDCYE